MFRANDPDAGVNGEIFYSLSERSKAEYGQLFSVDSRSGVISQRVPVDFETHRDPITMHVVAKDGGDSSLSATSRVVVTVRNINDHAPEIHFETTGTGSDNDDSTDQTGKETTDVIESGSDVIAGRENDSNVDGSGNEVTGSGSDVTALHLVENSAAGEFLVHMSVDDLDSGNAGRVHCTMPSSHFTLVRMYPNEYKVCTLFNVIPANLLT